MSEFSGVAVIGLVLPAVFFVVVCSVALWRVRREHPDFHQANIFQPPVHDNFDGDVADEVKQAD